MAKRANPNNTVESVLGRCGVPTAKTINTNKRCLGALVAVNFNIARAVANLSGPGFFGTRKSLKKSSIRYYVNNVSRLSAREQFRLSNMSTDRIIARIAQLKK